MGKTSVVFLKDMPPHGLAGDIKEVARGFARNVLFVRGTAVLPTPAVLRQAELIRGKREEQARLYAERMEVVAKKLKGFRLTFRKKANVQGGLFDAIDKREIIDELAAQGIEGVEEKYIELERPIDTLGAHAVAIHLGKNMPSVSLAVSVEQEETPKN